MMISIVLFLDMYGPMKSYFDGKPALIPRLVKSDNVRVRHVSHWLKVHLLVSVLARNGIMMDANRQ